MAYASAVRQQQAETTRITYGDRPRSLDILAPLDTETAELIEAIISHPILNKQKDEIMSIFQIGRNTFNLSFHKESDVEKLKESFLTTTKEGITMPKGKAFLSNPRQPTVKINIRAVPSEVEEDEIRQKMERYKCGVIREIKRIYHKGTNIENGYRQVSVEDYVSGKVPPFIYLGKAPCKVYLPTVGENEKCFKCLLVGHVARDCPNETTCIGCRKTGHRRENCPENIITPTRLQENQHKPVNQNIPHHPKKILHVDQGMLQSGGKPEVRPTNIERTQASPIEEEGKTKEREKINTEVSQISEETVENLLEDLFGGPINTSPETQEEATQVSTNAETEIEPNNMGMLIIDTSEGEAEDGGERDEGGESEPARARDRRSHTANLRKKFEATNTLTEAQFFRQGKSPYKRKKDEVSPPQKKGNNQKKKK